MEYIVISLICIIFLILLAIILELNIKKIKELGENKELNELTKDFPENIEICNYILKKLDNTRVKVKEDKDSKTSLYVVVGDTITIANIRDSYTRIQTIAHECVHSIQSKKMLWFNFIYTNLYIIYFLAIILLTLFKLIHNQHIFLCVLIIGGMVHYFIRSMLETEAMIKARYIAKEYMEETRVCTKEICDKIVEQYDKLNNAGIKLVNFDILVKDIAKVIIYCVICMFI